MGGGLGLQTRRGLLQQTRQICRNRTPATVQQGKQKKSESSLAELDEPRPAPTEERADQGCPKDQTTGTEIPAIDPQDSDYRRLKYCRYADDFAFAFIGPKAEEEAIKQRLRTFLCEELKLELSEEKTLITHTRDSAAKFLGYEITTRQSNTKRTLDRNGYRGRSINGDIGLKVPQKVVKEKCK